MSARDLLAPYGPTRGDPFDLRKAGHLLRRAGLGGSMFERRLAMQRGPSRAVDMLFEPGPGEDVDAVANVATAVKEIGDVRAYRVWRLLRGRERVRERVSLFWHDHFATSFAKVQDAAAMARQLRTFDALGLGRFDELLLAVARDPAMIRWLDNDTNVKGRPNENFARELFELFGLGLGVYTERDVKDAARAFTGWTVADGRYRFSRRRHDGEEKTVLGETGPLRGEDVIAKVAAHPASARFLAHKWLTVFVHPEPTDAEVEAVAGLYAASNRDVGLTLRTLFKSELFFSDRAVRSRIADPIELVVGTVRALGANASARRLADAAVRLGQALGEPPTVEGWPRERQWITSATWLLRQNFAAELFAGRYAMQPGADALLGEGTPRVQVERAVELLHDGVLSEASRRALADFVDSDAARGPGAASAILHAVKVLPEGQLW